MLLWAQGDGRSYPETDVVAVPLGEGFGLAPVPDMCTADSFFKGFESCA